VMSALHFDFCLALQIVSDAEMSSNNTLKFGEDETNKKIFGNVLNSFKNIETKHPRDLVLSLAGN